MAGGDWAWAGVGAGRVGRRTGGWAGTVPGLVELASEPGAGTGLIFLEGAGPGLGRNDAGAGARFLQERGRVTAGRAVLVVVRKVAGREPARSGVWPPFSWAYAGGTVRLAASLLQGLRRLHGRTDVSP